MNQAAWILTGATHCHGQVARAIRRGELPHPVRDCLKCTDCSGNAIEYDHRDYNQPLAVQPVCRRCNLRRGPAIRRRWSPRDPDVMEMFRRRCSRPVLPWARDYCLKWLSFLVEEIEEATAGQVTRYDLRPDIFGPAPESPAEAAA